MGDARGASGVGGEVDGMSAPDYKRVYHDRQMRLEHRIRAERALGRPLPPGAQVHHLDGTKQEGAPIAICQDASYHKLLHVRMKIRAAGGDPDLDHWCSRCQQPLPRTEFGRSVHQHRQLDFYCRACRTTWRHQNYWANRDQRLTVRRRRA